jgi:hypothetical protein
MKTGIATFALDYGKCPKWLFERMRKMAGLMAEIIIEEFGEEEFMKKLSDPYWFQAFGCALAFDWNSSGLTVTTTAALKEALQERNLGIYVCGGKGKTSKKTPSELLSLGEKLGIETKGYINLSRLTAKIDNSLIQDGFNIYHHSFILTKKGNWAVIQQGMNTNLIQARRYHWHSEQKQNNIVLLPQVKNQPSKVKMKMQNAKIDDGVLKNIRVNPCLDPRESVFNNLTTEPHTGIVSNIRLQNVLNLTHMESIENKKLIVEMVNQPQELIKDLKYLANANTNKSRMIKSLFLPNIEFHHHPVADEKFDTKRLKKIISQASFLEPQNIEDLLLIKGMGPRTIRAISLIAELIYNKNVSRLDPARYSFTYGGKDGTPYFVDKKTYDESIEILRKATIKAKAKIR